jgi:hypothetical protein
MSRGCKLGRMNPCGSRAMLQGWELCRCRASWMPRRARGKRSDGHQERDRQRPVGTRLLARIIWWFRECLQHTTPTCLSTVAMRLFASFFMSLLETSFSIANTTPSLHRIPIAVPPFSTAFVAYSTWKLRPSGEKTELERSYPVPIDVLKIS